MAILRRVSIIAAHRRFDTTSISVKEWGFRMAKKLDELPFEDADEDCLIAVVETPRGSRNKLDYDPKMRAFRLAAVLPEGTVFPFDFGFFLSTKADDGDPLDVMILMDEPVPMGCLVPVRLIGAIESEQRKEGEDWVRNDRLLAVAAHAHTHGNINSIKDMNPKQIDELEAFFHHYNRLKGTEFRVLGRAGPKSARSLLDNARIK